MRLSTLAEDVELPAGPTCSGDYCYYLPIVSQPVCLDLKGRSYYYAGSLRMAMRDEERGVSWIYGDHLGSISVTADKNGILTSKTTYTPWGTTRNISGSNPSDYGFTGQRKEDDIYYYGARWPQVPEAQSKGFDPSIGRFMQADIIVPLQVQGTQAFDRYAYVKNNPLRYVDPTGMWMCGDQYDPACAETPEENNNYYSMLHRVGSYSLSMVFVGGRDRTHTINQYSAYRGISTLNYYDLDTEEFSNGSWRDVDKIIVSDKLNRLMDENNGGFYFVCHSAGGDSCMASYMGFSSEQRKRVRGMLLLEPSYTITVPAKFFEQNSLYLAKNGGTFENLYVDILQSFTDVLRLDLGASFIDSNYGISKVGHFELPYDIQIAESTLHTWGLTK